MLNVSLMSRVGIPVLQDVRACRNAREVIRPSIGVVRAGGFRNNVPLQKINAFFSPKRYAQRKI